MATKQFKSEKIEHYKSQFENAKVAVVADYKGLTVEEITELRRALQAQNASGKNHAFSRALQAGQENLCRSLPRRQSGHRLQSYCIFVRRSACIRVISA